ncbi:hypothetical protein [Vibrio harveyi]|uniref:hypothetical protein n=1 Tax=Vibrio harveyi TaxID=669 RepID=UPI00339051AB
MYICAAFVGIIFIIGPSALIMNNLTNGIGIMLTEYIRMSTNTDPYGTTLFPSILDGILPSELDFLLTGCRCLHH